MNRNIYQITVTVNRNIDNILLSVIFLKKSELLPHQHMRSRAAFSFFGKDSAVFASENPRILFMAKRQKLQECVSHLLVLTQLRFFQTSQLITKFFCIY